MRKLLAFYFSFILSHINAQTLQWMTQAHVGAYNGNRITGFFIDSAGNSYLAGTGFAPQSPIQWSNFYKINSAGSIVFGDTLINKTIYSFNEYNTNFYSTGADSIRKWNSNGASLGSIALLDSNEYLYTSGAIIRNGFLYAIGYFNYLYKYDLSGNLIWRRTLSSPSTNEKIVLSNSSIYVYNYSGTCKIFKYDINGNLKWGINPGIAVNNIFADANDNCYVLGSGISLDYIVKIDSSGQIIWTSIHDSLSLKNGFAKGDSVFVCGGAITANNPNPTQDDFKSGFAIFSSNNGQLISTKYFNWFYGLCSDEIFDYVSFDGQNLFVAGTYCGQGRISFVAKIALTDQVSVNEVESLAPSIFTVYPNPTSDHLIVSYKGLEETEIILVVRNQLGQVILLKRFPKTAKLYETLNLSAFRRGIYTIEIINGKTKQVRQIILE